jgi:outer membrane beta-barrel protein
MQTTTIARSLFAAALAFAPLASALAQATPQQPSNEQVIVPQVERRELKIPRLPSNDFEAGAFLGTYATQNFGASVVAGLRVGYHVTEDFFVEGVYAATKVSDDSFRQILPGGVLTDDTRTLKYYNLSVGYNVLPGEVFFGKNRAKLTSIYLIGGIGSTDFNGQKRQTFNLGSGVRLMLSDRIALQVDARDHVFSLDVLGKRQTTQNLEFTGGVTFFF